MLYDIGFLIFALFYIPALIFKGKFHADFRERFGEYGPAKEEALWKARDVIWIQAVSVGVVALCKGFVPLLRREFPGSTIVFSTITKAGNDLAKKMFHDDAIVIYFPLDFSFIADTAIRKIRPRLYIMVETEIWPNVLRYVSRRGAGPMMINGRISDRSVGKYMLARPFLRSTLGSVKLFCMQSKEDAERIIDIGADSLRVRVTGNMKFDIDARLPDASGSGGLGIFGLGAKDRVIVAGSTHDGEEESLILVYKELLKSFPALRLVIAPRHVARSDEVARLVSRLGFRPVRFTQYSPTADNSGAVYIIDEIGHLNQAYAAAEAVFIGGSLIPHGGQNPIEPAVFARPVLFGPYMFNFRTVVSELLKNKAAIQVKGQGELLEKFKGLLTDGAAASEMGRRARDTVSSNRGATARNVDAIRELMNG